MPFKDLVAPLVFSNRVRERCWKKTGRMLATTRLPLEKCFFILEERARQDKAACAFVFREMRNRLNAGFSPGKAIAPFASSEEVMLIDSGAMAGSASLASAFARAAKLLEKRRLLHGCIARELSYPLALMIQRTARTAGSLAMILVTLAICLVVSGLFGIQEEITSAVGAMGGI